MCAVTPKNLWSNIKIEVSGTKYGLEPSLLNFGYTLCLQPSLGAQFAVETFVINVPVMEYQN